jgi:hypothetical protein
MSDKYELCSIETSDKKDKKYDAKFREKGCPCSRSKTPECGKKETIVSFGAKGMSDYTKHKDEERKKLYLARHKANENWDDPTTAGSLSRYLLWDTTNLDTSIKNFKKRFNL